MRIERNFVSYKREKEVAGDWKRSVIALRKPCRAFKLVKHRWMRVVFIVEVLKFLGRMLVSAKCALRKKSAFEPLALQRHRLVIRSSIYDPYTMIIIPMIITQMIIIHTIIIVFLFE